MKLTDRQRQLIKVFNRGKLIEIQEIKTFNFNKFNKKNYQAVKICLQDYRFVNEVIQIMSVWMFAHLFSKEVRSNLPGGLCLCTPCYRENNLHFYWKASPDSRRCCLLVYQFMFSSK